MNKITRSTEQAKVLELSKNNDILILEACTGFGKSLMAIMVQNGAKEFDSKQVTKKTLIFVPEKSNRMNITQEYIKHGLSGMPLR